MLEVRGLVAGYGTVPVLRNIDIAVSGGEIFLIAGENGAGKSTLLRAIAGLIRPDAGEVLLEGRNVAGLAPEILVAAGLRLVLDGHQVFPELTVLDNLRLGAAARGGPKQECERDLEEMLTFFPILREKLRSHARDLSGGQQQMVALAQAFMAKPSVLLCDEPSTGLAIALMPPIMAFLKECARRGTAIVIVEQHIELALEVADRTVLMERGAIAFRGSPAEFRAHIARRVA